MFDFFRRHSAVSSEQLAAILKLLNEKLQPVIGPDSLKPDCLQAISNKVTVSLPFVCQQYLYANEELFADLKDYCQQQSIVLSLNWQVCSTKGLNPARIKNVIAVSSGKGGVGKSTVAVNLAKALQLQGANVGILDADIYGPSIPALLGTQEQGPDTPDNKNMYPIIAQQMQSISIGNLVNDDDAAVWRGPMASKALQQLFNETLWQQLDYLIVDMPPGTGDIQLTLAQKLPVAAAIVVTTPQQLAVVDAIKGVAMFNKVSVPVLGVVENMSYLDCGNCSNKQYLFGQGGGQTVANKYELPLLSEIPFAPQLQFSADIGELWQKDEYPQVKECYLQLATKVSYQMSQQPVAAQQIPVVSQ